MCFHLPSPTCNNERVNHLSDVSAHYTNGHQLIHFWQILSIQPNHSFFPFDANFWLIASRSCSLEFPCRDVYRHSSRFGYGEASCGNSGAQWRVCTNHRSYSRNASVRCFSISLWLYFVSHHTRFSYFDRLVKHRQWSSKWYRMIYERSIRIQIELFSFLRTLWHAIHIHTLLRLARLIVRNTIARTGRKWEETCDAHELQFTNSSLPFVKHRPNDVPKRKKVCTHRAHTCTVKRQTAVGRWGEHLQASRISLSARTRTHTYPRSKFYRYDMCKTFPISLVLALFRAISTIFIYSSLIRPRSNTSHAHRLLPLSVVPLHRPQLVFFLLVFLRWNVFDANSIFDDPRIYAAVGSATTRQCILLLLAQYLLNLSKRLVNDEIADPTIGCDLVRTSEGMCVNAPPPHRATHSDAFHIVAAAPRRIAFGPRRILRMLSTSDSKRTKKWIHICHSKRKWKQRRFNKFIVEALAVSMVITCSVPRPYHEYSCCGKKILVIFKVPNANKKNNAKWRFLPCSTAAKSFFFLSSHATPILDAALFAYMQSNRMPAKEMEMRCGCGKLI